MTRPTLLCLTLLACTAKTEPEPADSEPTPEDTALPPIGESEVQVTLRASYARPALTDWDGLDYDQITTEPIRRAEVWVRRTDTDELLSAGLTGLDGSFVFTAPSSAPLQAGVVAQVPDYGLSVVDNTNEDALYTLLAERRAPVDDDDWTVHAGLAHDGARYTDRSSGAFAALDTALRVTEAVDEVHDGAFPPLVLHWSPNNAPVRGDLTLGQINTSHYRSSSGIYLLGAEDVDTDEYDAPVIAHEWMHYFERNLARSDTKGGSHDGDALLHPSVAFSEGGATALGCIALRSPYYRDSDDPQQADGFEQDIEDNQAGGVVGWYSSRSASSLIWDLSDALEDDADAIALSDAELFGLWTGPLREAAPMLSLYVLGQLVRETFPEHADAVDALWIGEQMVAPLDGWGTGEHNDGGDPQSLPLYRPILLGEVLTLDPLGPSSSPNNRIGDWRNYRHDATESQQLAARTTGELDIDLRVYLRGEELCESRSGGGVERCVFPAVAGERYVIEVDGSYLEASGAFTVTLEPAP